MFESSGPATRTLGLSNSDPMTTLPLNSPGWPGTAGMLNDLRGCLACTTPVATEMLSESVTPNTVTLGCAERRGSSTVTSTVSLHSYRLTRTTTIAAEG